MTRWCGCTRTVTPSGRWPRRSSCASSSGRTWAWRTRPQQLGDLYQSRQRLDEAKAVLTRALEAARRSGTLIGDVNACDALGEVSLRLGDLDAARQFYLRAHDLSVAHGYRRGEAWTLYGLGRCGYALELWQEAHQLFASALAVDQGKPAKLRHCAGRDGAWPTPSGLHAICNWVFGNPAELAAGGCQRGNGRPAWTDARDAAGAGHLG